MKILLFDMMDTLVSEPYPVAFEWLLTKRDITFELFQKYRHADTYINFESGFIGEYEFYRDYYRPELSSEIQGRLPRPARIKKEMFKNPTLLPGVADLIDELLIKRENTNEFQIGIASNNSIWYHQILDRLPVLRDQMDYLFFSCEMGQRKPARRYYDMIEQALSERLSSGSPEIFFADDRRHNLTFPKRLGWKIHHMLDVFELRQAVMGFLNS